MYAVNDNFSPVRSWCSRIIRRGRVMSASQSEWIVLLPAVTAADAATIFRLKLILSEVNPLFSEVCHLFAGSITPLSELILFFMTYCFDLAQVSKSVAGLPREASSASGNSGSWTFSK